MKTPRYNMISFDACVGYPDNNSTRDEPAATLYVVEQIIEDLDNLTTFDKETK